jgi:hypothetical protein
MGWADLGGPDGQAGGAPAVISGGSQHARPPAIRAAAPGAGRLPILIAVCHHRRRGVDTPVPAVRPMFSHRDSARHTRAELTDAQGPAHDRVMHACMSAPTSLSLSLCVCVCVCVCPQPPYHPGVGPAHRRPLVRWIPAAALPPPPPPLLPAASSSPHPHRRRHRAPSAATSAGGARRPTTRRRRRGWRWAQCLARCYSEETHRLINLFILSTRTLRFLARSSVGHR